MEEFDVEKDKNPGESQQNASIVLVEKELQSIDLTSSQDDAVIPTDAAQESDIQMAEAMEEESKEAPEEASGGCDIDAAYSKENNIQHHVYPNDSCLKIIEEVKNYPLLYDKNHEHAKDIVQKLQAWTKVAEKLGMKKSECKKIFHSTFVRFSTVYTALRDPGMDKEEKEKIFKKKFIYYDHMLFFSKYVDVERMKADIAARVRQSKMEKKKNQKKAAAAEKQKAAKTKLTSPQQSMVFKKQRSDGPAQQMSVNFSRPENFLRNPYLQNNTFNNMLNNMSNIPGNGPYGPPFSQGPPHGNYSGPPGAMRQPMDMIQRMNPPMPPQSGANQQQRSSQNSNDNFMPDDTHIDFFFKSVSQQVKKSNISDRNFLDLQSRILDALSFKLYGFRSRRDLMNF